MKFFSKTLLALLALAATLWWAIGADWRRFLATMPSADVLSWNAAQRDAGYRMLDKLPLLVKSNVIAAGGETRPLPMGDPLAFDFDIEAYKARQNRAGLLILQGGEIRYESYDLDFTKTGRWTSFSVAKSFTSTLIGLAIKDGHVSSLDDKVSDYVDELKGTPYDEVSLHNLITMQSGVKWIENFSDPQSDTPKLGKHSPPEGQSQFASYMGGQPRLYPPGTVWNYSTAETGLLGVIVRRATGKSPAHYLSEKVWTPYGMEADASWLLNSVGEEMAGCCIQARLRDYARFGQYILEGGMINGTPTLPDGWLEVATQNQSAGPTMFGRGYGYQWWTLGEDTFAAYGFRGQSIYVDPKRALVIASFGNWHHPLGDGGERDDRADFYAKIAALVDAEQSSQ